MPPIGETLSVFGEIRQRVGTNRAIHLGLLGKPTADAGWSEVAAQDQAIWSDTVSSLGDPYLLVHALPAVHESYHDS
jgi:hypothetical protein